MDNKEVECESTKPGKVPIRINRWKYEIISKAIEEIIPEKGEGILFQELPKLVSKRLDNVTEKKIGALGWYTNTVEQDLECKHKIHKVEGTKPLRLLKTK